MRIAIVNSTGGGMSCGYQTYLRNMIPGLAKHPQVEAVLCAHHPQLSITEWFDPPPPNTSFIHCPPFRPLWHRPDLRLEQQMRRFRPDVVFVPLERYLSFPAYPFVTMLQTMLPLSLFARQYQWRERLRLRLQALEARIAVGRADQVIAPSQFVSDFLTSQWTIPPHRVSTIHYGVTQKTKSDDELLRRPKSIPDVWQRNFFFTVASTIEPYRGIEELLSVVLELKKQGRSTTGLVIAGAFRPTMSWYQRKLEYWIVLRNLSSHIRFTGLLRDDEIAWCYANCAAYIMASRVESFGLTGLEALSHGCICIVVEQSPFQEIFGQEAIYYAPGDISALTDALDRVITVTEGERRLWADAARARAASFSWQRTVDQTVATFERAVADHTKHQ